ncbi:MAG: hypothetical protein NTU43_04785, partial [Bacteroidetes bacterium]|nr:hypothetical protein [Bacteroidota bacterium]
MRTIKTMALLVLLVLTQYTLYAQKGKMKDKIETMKIGFITQKLNLTSEEAQKFWPVYNKFSDDLQKLRSTSKDKIMEDLSELATMS